MAEETIYQCRDRDGGLSFSDYPCPSDSVSEGKRTVQNSPVKRPTTAGITAQCQSSGGDLNQGNGFGPEFRAGLPEPQRAALELALQTLADEGSAAYRWRRSAAADLHLCGRSRRGEEIEVVAASAGQVVLFQRGVGRYLNDPETPDALRERCGALVTACFVPPDTSIDSCVHLSRSCSSVPPWTEAEACCPQACKDQYAEHRSEGMEPLKALRATLYEPPGCVAGASLR
jgi:hypothetical protein